MMTPQNVVNTYESLFRVLRMREEFFGMEFKLLSVQPKPKKAPKQDERPDAATSERPCEDVKTNQTHGHPHFTAMDKGPSSGPESEDEKCIHILPVWHWALPWACYSRRRAFGATSGKGAAADE